MFSLKIKKSYLPPVARTAEADLEGLICLSAFKAVNVDQLRNMNAEPADELEPFYFESNE